VEYAFGNSHAPYAQRLGGEAGGIVVHQPRKAGPHNVYKETIVMGATKMSAAQVEAVASEFSSSTYQLLSYNRIQHNCVDFAMELCSSLGVSSDFPAWCCRGTSTARMIGLGDAPQTPRSSSTPLARSESGSSCTLTSRSAATDPKSKLGLAPTSMRVPQRKRADSTAFNEEEDGVNADDSLACADLEVPTDETIPHYNKTLLASFPPVTPRRLGPSCDGPSWAGARLCTEVCLDLHAQHGGLDRAVLKWECSKLPNLPLKRPGKEPEEFSESTDVGSENSRIVDVDAWTGTDQASLTSEDTGYLSTSTPVSPTSCDADSQAHFQQLRKCPVAEPLQYQHRQNSHDWIHDAVHERMLKTARLLADANTGPLLQVMMPNKVDV
jgi:hypothetical protein